VRFSLIVAAVLVAVAWLIWGVGIAVLVATGSMFGLLIGAFRRALTEPIEDRIERYCSRHDDQP
jgi:hypothetical protein